MLSVIGWPSLPRCMHLRGDTGLAWVKGERVDGNSECIEMVSNNYLSTPNGFTSYNLTLGNAYMCRVGPEATHNQPFLGLAEKKRLTCRAFGKVVQAPTLLARSVPPVHHCLILTHPIGGLETPTCEACCASEYFRTTNG